MEFWEGAVLVIGGIWLVGKIHRTQISSLAAAAPVSLPSTKVAGPTSATNTDGSGYLVAGETLGTGTTSPISSSCPTCNLTPGAGGSGNFAAGSKLKKPNMVML